MLASELTKVKDLVAHCVPSEVVPDRRDDWMLVVTNDPDVIN